MKKICIRIVLAVSILTLFLGCEKSHNEGSLQRDVANILKALVELKPGLGEIMSVIQQHHEKLYFSGINENWELAAYELEEIEEGLDQATQLHDHYRNIKVSLKEMRHITDESLHALDAAIQQKSKLQFANRFHSLTQSCNQCHQGTEHGFIVIQAPTASTYTNQKFSKITLK